MSNQLSLPATLPNVREREALSHLLCTTLCSGVENNEWPRREDEEPALSSLSQKSALLFQPWSQNTFNVGSHEPEPGPVR